MLRLVVALFLGALQGTLLAANPPRVGETAPDFTLKTLDHKAIQLSELTPDNNVVLLVLRGWPGYQCPICTAQVQDYIAAAPHFAAAKARVLMVYPGPAPDLEAHAQEFLKSKQWPQDFLYVIDPDFTMVKAYGLRWDAPQETAYPSTFLIDRKGVVRFAKISHSHGDRTKASEVVEELKRLPASK